MRATVFHEKNKRHEDCQARGYCCDCCPKGNRVVPKPISHCSPVDHVLTPDGGDALLLTNYITIDEAGNDRRQAGEALSWLPSDVAGYILFTPY
jgi:hypothetical protein